MAILIMIMMMLVKFNPFDINDKKIISKGWFPSSQYKTTKHSLNTLLTRAYCRYVNGYQLYSIYNWVLWLTAQWAVSTEQLLWILCPKQASHVSHVLNQVKTCRPRQEQMCTNQILAAFNFGWKSMFFCGMIIDQLEHRGLPGTTAFFFFSSKSFLIFSFSLKSSNSFLNSKSWGYQVIRSVIFINLKPFAWSPQSHSKLPHARCVLWPCDRENHLEKHKHLPYLPGYVVFLVQKNPPLFLTISEWFQY